MIIKILASIIIILASSISNGQEAQSFWDNENRTDVVVQFEPDWGTFQVREYLTAYVNIFLLDAADGGYSFEIADPYNAEIANTSLDSIDIPQNLTIGILGKFVGKTELRILKGRETGQIGQKENKVKELELVRAYPVSILRTNQDQKLSSVFTAVLVVMQFINTFIMGLQLDWKVIMKVIKKPIAPIIGFVCQFGFMPPIAYAWGLLFLKDAAALHFGYFAVGCCPGGGMSNVWSLLLDGNLDLSITMTFFSNIAALGMMPAWIYSLGREITKLMRFGDSDESPEVEIPFVNMASGLILLICPIFLGMLVKRCRPDAGEKTKKLVKISSFLMLIIALPLGLYTNRYLFLLITWRTILCGFCLPFSGFLLSFIAAIACRRNLPDSKTIAIETGIQNASIAIVLMRFSLPEPDFDLSIVLPLCVLIMTPIPLFFALIIQTIVKCVKKRNSVEKEPEIPLENQQQSANGGGDSSPPSAGRNERVSIINPNQVAATKPNGASINTDSNYTNHQQNPPQSSDMQLMPPTNNPHQQPSSSSTNNNLTIRPNSPAPDPPPPVPDVSPGKRQAQPASPSKINNAKAANGSVSGSGNNNNNSNSIGSDKASVQKSEPPGSAAAPPLQESLKVETGQNDDASIDHPQAREEEDGREADNRRAATENGSPPHSSSGVSGGSVNEPVDSGLDTNHSSASSSSAASSVAGDTGSSRCRRGDRQNNNGQSSSPKASPNSITSSSSSSNLSSTSYTDNSQHHNHDDHPNIVDKSSSSTRDKTIEINENDSGSADEALGRNKKMTLGTSAPAALNDNNIITLKPRQPISSFTKNQSAAGADLGGGTTGKLNKLDADFKDHTWRSRTLEKYKAALSQVNHRGTEETV